MNEIVVKVLVGLIAAAIIASIAAVAFGIAAFKCHNTWDTSGMNVEYRIFSGCMLEHTPGKWIPEKSYRTVE